MAKVKNGKPLNNIKHSIDNCNGKGNCNICLAEGPEFLFTKQFTTGAKKEIKDKLPLHLVPPEVSEIFAEVSAVGLAKGYEARNWEKGMPICEGHLAAAKRHINAFEKGEDYNYETTLDGSFANSSHLAHAAWHLMASSILIKRGMLIKHPELDDRRKEK